MSAGEPAPHPTPPLFAVTGTTARSAAVPKHLAKPPRADVRHRPDIVVHPSRARLVFGHSLSALKRVEHDL